MCLPVKRRRNLIKQIPDTHTYGLQQVLLRTRRRNSNDELFLPEPWMETVTPGKFERFQKAIFLAIEQIIAQPEYANHSFATKWKSLKRVPKTPMSDSITWRHVKIILGIKDLFDYKAFLQGCPNLHNYIRIQPSITTNRGFDFGVYAYSGLMQDTEANTVGGAEILYESDVTETPKTERPTIQEIPAVTPKLTIQELDPDIEEHNPPTPPAQVPFFPPFTQLSDDTDESYVEIPENPENPDVTPRQDNTTLKDVDEPSAIVGPTELSLPRDGTWNTNDETTGFRTVHYRLFESVTVWMQQEGDNKTPFSLKWRKAIFEGLTGLTPWVRVAKIFKLQYLRDYVTLMYECPGIREQFELTWDYFDNTIRLKDLKLPELADITNDVNKINALYAKMKDMAFSFEFTLQQVSKRIDDINTHLTGCERGITEQLNRVADRLAGKVSHHMQSITDYATSSLTKFGKQTEEITSKSIKAVQTQMHQMQTDSRTRLEADFKRLESRIEEHLDQAIEKALQEINCTADEATEDLHNQIKLLVKNIPDSKETAPDKKEHFMNVPAKPSKLFPNVDHTAFNKPQFNLPDQEPQVETSDSQDHWDKNGPPAGGNINPNSNTHMYTYPSGLPMVCHNDALKRVNIQYPGREQSYMWYSQISSGLEQYGIYLIHAEDFRKDKSLCPTMMYGIPIDAHRYHTMKRTLYHFLAQRNIVSFEDNDIRNIINRYSNTTDGYRVMYEIMQRQHPKLNPDITFDPPVSKDYANVHEYYNYVTAYFLHEKYSGRNYTQREQINQFLKGLDSTYKYAVKRIKSLMDTWDITDTRVPDNLQLENLPIKVDQYMEEDGNVPTVHRLNRNNGGPKNNYRERTTRDTTQDADKHTDDQQRKYVDSQCPLCKSYGHQKHQCDRMAVWLNLKEGAQQLDERFKTKLLANYAEVDAKRRARRVAKLKGTVRQLYQAGDYIAGDQLMDTLYLSQSTYDDTGVSDSDSSATP